jgi:hypothetical protein
MKEKNSSILTKALNEADTIRAGAMKNAQDILFQAFQPHFKQMFENVVNEQVGVVNQDPMAGPEASKYDQDKAEADLVNPSNAMHKEGDGPELLEQEDDVDLDLEEQEGADDEDFLEQLEAETGDEPIEEQEEDLDLEEQAEADADDLNLEQEDIDDLEVEQDETDDLDLEEQADETDDLDLEEQVEDDDMDFDMSEQADDVDDLQFEQDDIEVVDDETSEQEDMEDLDLEEQDTPNVNISKDAASKTAANENKKLKVQNSRLKSRVNSLLKENQKLNIGVTKLANKISEVTLFNAKVACANRVLSIRGLNEDSKVTVLNTLDKCKNIREVKVAYTSFKNFLRTNSVKRTNSIKESRNIAALRTKTVGYRKTNVISEADNKMLRLAGLKD